MRGLSLLLGVLLLFALLFLDLHLKPTAVVFSNEGVGTAATSSASSTARRASSVATIHVKFVLCRLTKAEQRVLIALDILRFEDAIVLNCTENMNAGKTYVYFSSLPTVLPHWYDDLYYGAAVPCASRDPSAGHMSGMGFVLSWDLVQWIATSKIPASDTNRVAEKPAAMYDCSGTNGRCSHELIPGTVVVYRLKRWDRWLPVLGFFNVTEGLKPSKLDYIDPE
ncbi:Galactosyltransferase [Musa troglodytarum]|uniref:Galactosyltransferase n=1 Tax=Musa troglodytarum TaxID=320322 RepID=A0A9E7HCG5_9LILI|nr:Galactosyltransferase [Musa troglodytarum]